MITTLLYSHNKKELLCLRNEGFEVSCKISDEDWEFLCCEDKKKVFDELCKHSIIDISLVDVIAESGVEIAEKIRKENESNTIIILADSTISPMLYIKPSIKATSLLLRPLSRENIKEVFFESFKEYINKVNSDSDDSSFVIDNREGKKIIPNSKILFFESRDKKIYLSLGVQEYSIYDTLDNLEHRLSSDFIRCHRSFIVAKSKIESIKFSENIIFLDGGYSVPLSRSYKGKFKGIK